MKTALIALMAMGFSGAALADGFVCDTLDGVYTVKVYNHTQPTAGTRNAAIMIVSDNTIQSGRKTIATFESENGLLSSQSLRYVADVDLRFSNSNRSGENILGTKLGMVDTLTLDVNFSYDEPVSAGEEIAGKVIVAKRNGQKIKSALSCVRYLKN